MLLNAGVNLALREDFAHLTFVCASSAMRVLWWSVSGVRGWWSRLEICVIDIVLVSLLLLNLDLFHKSSIKYFIFKNNLKDYNIHSINNFSTSSLILYPASICIFRVGSGVLQQGMKATE